ncbi:MAG TPA: glycoside hydrolase family 3 N-terminal domain-containing protein [Verrucomicrobiota bacterium]|nr:glycoside hydrolase family 3 N-terminal domain-containing protein [Verrucomicrobiota bacterium]
MIKPKLALCGTILLLTLATTPLHGAIHFSRHEKAVDALLARMTLDEKIGQMVQADCAALKDKSHVAKYFLGSVLSGGDSDPDSGNTAQDWLNWISGFQDQALQTRLKIPILYGVDAVHGHNNVDGAVVFPHNIGLGATHDRKLVKRAAEVTAREVAGTGSRWAFAPCVAVPQDDRWGRTYEGFGDNTDLVSELGVEATIGLQGRKLSSKPATVLASAKHYVGDGGTTNGIDQGDMICDEATLRKIHLPPYRAAIEAGVGSIMVSYSSWNGKKLHGHKYLITDVLKGELGFRGFVVSDWAAIDQLSSNYKDNVERSINAGLDMVMIPNGPGKANHYVEFIEDLKALVAEGKVSQSRIDDAVRRILRVKFQMGLFESTAVDPKLTAAIGSPKHRAVARECVRNSLVLLKNENRALPLSKNIRHLAVVGAAADDLGMQCGGWTVKWQGERGNVMTGGTTLLAAIRESALPKTTVTYSADGSDLKNADAIIVVVGEAPYAEGKGDIPDLNLASADRELIAKARAAGAPVVTILYSGRPLVLGSALTDSDAFIAAWLPGTEGAGITDVLFGDHPFTGKLPRAWPASNDRAEEPLLPFGYGLKARSRR